MGGTQDPAQGDLSIEPPPIATDKSVKYDYDIVYVQAPRGDKGKARWAEVGDPRTMEPGADLMLLHPDGKEEVLVAVKPHESIADPMVSFDGTSVYYAKMHDALKHKGADLYKIHVPTRRKFQLTSVSRPTQAAAGRRRRCLPGRLQSGAVSAPDSRLVFVGNRNAFKASNPGYAERLALQLFS